jgi:hypothetical protein
MTSSTGNTTVKVALDTSERFLQRCGFADITEVVIETSRTGQRVAVHGVSRSNAMVVMAMAGMTVVWAMAMVRSAVVTAERAMTMVTVTTSEESRQRVCAMVTMWARSVMAVMSTAQTTETAQTEAERSSTSTAAKHWAEHAKHWQERR